MLYLNVKPGDKLFIGEGDQTIVVSFESRSRDTAKLGVNAPKDIKVTTVFADASEQFKKRQRKVQLDENR